jgi:hypothetical protein
MNKLQIEVTLINYDSKEVINTVIKSTETDFYIQKYCETKQVYTNEGINTDWVIYLCEKKLSKRLTNFNAQSYQIK